MLAYYPGTTSRDNPVHQLEVPKGQYVSTHRELASRSALSRAGVDDVAVIYLLKPSLWVAERCEIRLSDYLLREAYGPSVASKWWLLKMPVVVSSWDLVAPEDLQDLGTIKKIRGDKEELLPWEIEFDPNKIPFMENATIKPSGKVVKQLRILLGREPTALEISRKMRGTSFDDIKAGWEFTKP